MNFRPEDVLVALEEARRLIKTMPPDQVPHSLKRTRGSSSRRMTPVEANALYRELDRNGDFRRVILDGWAPPSLTDADRRTAASVLFLERSENWESQARGFLAEIALDETRVQMNLLKKRQRESQAKIASLKARADDIRRQAAVEIQRRTEDLNQDLKRARERIAKLERALAEQRGQTEFWEKQANSAFDDLDLADQRYDDLRDRYSSKKSSAVPLDNGRSGDMGFSRDPLQAARMLDQMVSFWEAGSGPLPPAAASPVRLELPPGIDPRSGEAMRWVFYEARRSMLVVDGWNVAYHWHYHQGNSEVPAQQTVEFVTNKLANLARYSIDGHRVNFYLDSRYALGIDQGWENRFQNRKLTGFYVENADDAIADEARRRTGQPVVAITSDKELADRCRVYGALVLASESLAEWMAESSI